MKSDWDVLVMDLDGTLLCAQGDVSNQNIHALDIVRDAGIEVVVATGRSYSECKHILDMINHKGISITAGGSSLHDGKGNVLDSETMQTEIVEEVTRNVLQGNHRCLLLKDSAHCSDQYVLVGDAPLHHASEWWFTSLGISLTEVDRIDKDPWPEQTLRVGAVAEANKLEPIAMQLEETLRGKAKLQHWSAVTCSQATGSETHLLEVFGKNVNKWTMLQRHHGQSLNPERVVAIGDGLNDIEVFREAGLSIVMSNANEEVQSHGDVIAGHHDEHGFAEALRRWVL